jgi:fructosamine-3-kinase
VLGRSDSDGGWSWLAVEWLEPGRSSEREREAMGRGLAKLHRSVGEAWGADQDGFIGRLPQSNAAEPDWASFWWRRRLLPQVERTGWVGGKADWDLLIGKLPELLEAGERDQPSVLHGDLWSGNVVWSADGPALVDPASYYGHREVDLAMMELFGGFGERCLAAYEEVWPLESGSEARRAVYQLYYLLVHINLFGASYVPRTLETLRFALKHG